MGYKSFPFMLDLLLKKRFRDFFTSLEEFKPHIEIDNGWNVDDYSNALLTDFSHYSKAWITIVYRRAIGLPTRVSIEFVKNKDSRDGMVKIHNGPYIQFQVPFRYLVPIHKEHLPVACIIAPTQSDRDSIDNKLMQALHGIHYSFSLASDPYT